MYPEADQRAAPSPTKKRPAAPLLSVRPRIAFAKDVLRRPGREGAQIVEERLGGRRADQSEDGDQNDESGEDREHAVVRQCGCPVGQVVLAELLHGARQHADPGSDAQLFPLRRRNAPHSHPPSRLGRPWRVRTGARRTRRRGCRAPLRRGRRSDGAPPARRARTRLARLPRAAHSDTAEGRSQGRRRLRSRWPRAWKETRTIEGSSRRRSAPRQCGERGLARLTSERSPTPRTCAQRAAVSAAASGRGSLVVSHEVPPAAATGTDLGRRLEEKRKNESTRSLRRFSIRSRNARSKASTARRTTGWPMRTGYPLPQNCNLSRSPSRRDLGTERGEGVSSLPDASFHPRPLKRGSSSGRA